MRRGKVGGVRIKTQTRVFPRPTTLVKTSWVTRKLLSAKTPFAKLTHILPLRLKLTNVVIRAHFCCSRFPQAVLIVMKQKLYA